MIYKLIKIMLYRKVRFEFDGGMVEVLLLTYFNIAY